MDGEASEFSFEFLVDSLDHSVALRAVRSGADLSNGEFIADAGDFAVKFRSLVVTDGTWESMVGPDCEKCSGDFGS